jgi:hypothetical protein
MSTKSIFCLKTFVNATNFITVVFFPSLLAKENAIWGVGISQSHWADGTTFTVLLHQHNSNDVGVFSMALFILIIFLS